MKHDMQLKRQSRDVVDSRRWLEYCRPRAALDYSRDRTHCIEVFSYSYLARGLGHGPYRDGICWT